MADWSSNIQFRSVQFSHSVVSDSLWSHGLQHARPPWPSPTPRVYSNSRPLSQWCHLTISSSSPSPASGSFQMSQFFESGGQRIGVSASASVLPMNTQDWFPLGWTGWISLQSKGLSSEVKTLSHVRLCDPMDCSLPSSSIHRILQARVLHVNKMWWKIELPAFPVKQLSLHVSHGQQPPSSFLRFSEKYLGPRHLWVTLSASVSAT